jgi:hypothetical protein
VLASSFFGRSEPSAMWLTRRLSGSATAGDSSRLPSS